MVQSSLGLGGPQPAEVQRMLSAQRKQLAADQAWIIERQAKLASASSALNRAFTQLRESR
jgi:argininosuccinate lyase